MTSSALGIDRGASVAIMSDTFNVSVPTITEALILATASCGHLAKECHQGNDMGMSVSGSRRPGFQ